APWSDAAEARFHDHGITDERWGATGREEVASHLAGRASVRELGAVGMRVTRRLGQDLADWEGQVNSWTWQASAAEMKSACDDIRTWAEQSGWPLDRPVELERSITWWAFDSAGPAVPGGPMP